MALGGCSTEDGAEGPNISATADANNSGDSSIDNDGFGYDSSDVYAGVADAITPDTDNSDVYVAVDTEKDTGKCVEKKFYLDSDNDNFGDTENFIEGCKAVGKYNTFNTGDCDDTDASINPGAKELCNGLDDNCNTKIDENYKVGEVCTTGVGECKNTSKYVCKNDLEVECPANTKSAGKELCDGLDNNCDGSTDEYFKLGSACTSGKGGCAVTGKTICAPSQLETICDALAKKASPEICDNYDNDCNGEIDDALSQPCFGPCGGGKEYCHNGNWVDCDAEKPKKELCDGIDNDCDGQIDENFKNFGKSCYSGKGECSSPGKYICSSDEKKVICDGVPKAPSKEICDGKDNDCDGKIDEDFTIGYTCKVGVGECQTKGKYVCSDDKLSKICDATPGKPTQELCDGKDNNCNGKIDEYFNTGKDCSSGVNECQVIGKYICAVDQKSTVCDALPKKPGNELCDGKDNNCDGKVDEIYKLNEKCDVGVGECKTEGVSICAPNKLKTICKATPGKPSKELCDKLDNDCDGKVDENYNVGDPCSVGVGECNTKGVKICAPNKIQTICDAVAKKPSKELCDKLDNDCDGKVDNDCVTCFDTTFGTVGHDVAKSVLQTKDGGFIIGGYSIQLNNTNGDAVITKLDQDGAVTWTKSFGQNGNEKINKILQLADSSYVAVGSTTSKGKGQSDAWLLKLNEKGLLQDNKTYGGTSSDEANSFDVTSDGGSILAGHTFSSGKGGSDAYIVKVNSKGLVEFSKTHGLAGFDKASDIKQVKQSYFVAGETNSKGNGNTDLWLFKLNSNGIVEWDKTVGGTKYDAANSLNVTSDGGVIAVGYKSNNSGNTNAYAVKVNSNGIVEWDKTFGGVNSDYAESVVQMNNGNYVVAGHTTSKGSGGSDGWVFQLNPKGDLIKENIFGGSKGDNLNSIQQVSNGYVVAGLTESKGKGGADAWVIKLDEGLKVCK